MEKKKIAKELYFWHDVATICRLLIGDGIKISVWGYKSSFTKEYKFKLENIYGNAIFKEVINYCIHKIKYEYVNEKEIIENIDNELDLCNPKDVLALCEHMIDVLEDTLAKSDIKEIDEDFDRMRKLGTVVVAADLKTSEIKRTIAVFLKTYQNESNNNNNK